jgi:predicted RNA methylase
VKTRKDPEWWGQRCANGEGLEAIHCNPNGWSHDRRMEAIRREVGDCKSVLDLGCGTGLYGFMNPCDRYVGVDFCPEYIEVARKTVPGDFHCLGIKDFVAANTERFDAVVMCGVLSVEPAFDSDDDAFDFIKSLLSTADKVVATMPWAGFSFEETAHTTTSGLRKFTADAVIRLCHARGVSVKIFAGHMPHEILGVFTIGTWDDLVAVKSTRDAITNQLKTSRGTA